MSLISFEARNKNTDYTSLHPSVPNVLAPGNWTNRLWPLDTWPHLQVNIFQRSTQYIQGTQFDLCKISITYLYNVPTLILAPVLSGCFHEASLEVLQLLICFDALGLWHYAADVASYALAFVLTGVSALAPLGLQLHICAPVTWCIVCIHCHSCTTPGLTTEHTLLRYNVSTFLYFYIKPDNPRSWDRSNKY